ncbi:ATP-dependent Clp protease ATP-binding subunit [bacterium]|nr:ATP-dependent Clp protease ATP-binding subunit [bacterium]
MFNFDFRKSAIYQAIKWRGIFVLAKLLRELFLAAFLISGTLLFYGILLGDFSKIPLYITWIIFILSLGGLLLFWIEILFFELKIKHPKIRFSPKEVLETAKEVNLADLLDYQSAFAIWQSIQFAKSRKIPEINSSLVFYFLLENNPELNFVFSRLLLSLDDIKKMFRDYFKSLERLSFKERFSDDFQKTILESIHIAAQKSHQRIKAGDLLVALARKNPILKKFLINVGLRSEDIENLVWWIESIEEEIKREKKFWEWENLIKRGSLAKDWAAGYTVTLDMFSYDFSEAVKIKGFPEIIGYSKELKQMEIILSRQEINNVLIVGEPGTGRNSVVVAFAEKSVLGKLRPELNYKRIVMLDLPKLIAQAQGVEETEYLLDKIFAEVVKAGNVILVIDEIHNYLRGVTQTGIVDISGVISNYLHLPTFQIIAITTYKGLHEYIEQHPSLLSLFEKIELSELSEKESLMILERLVPALEKKHKLFVSYPALRDIITYCAKYIQDVPFPKKAIDMLDEVVIYVSSLKEKVVLPKHVAKVFTDKTEIPVGEIKAKEKEKLLNLEDLIHKRIIDQEEAVEDISDALRRARAEVTVRKRPMGTFLFLGPTGVGKTETAKALAEIYFGSEKKMIRLDMSEFQSVNDVGRLIGKPGQEGLLTTRVREDPFSLVLLDEFEKAHPNILNLFLQVLDEGHLTDGLGRKVSFQNTIVIATSNAGYLVILEAIKNNIPFSEVKDKLLDFIFKKGIFRPELVNRFDSVVIFKPLDKESLLKIAELLLSKPKENLAKKDIEFVITEPLKEKIVELGYDPTFGAREMRRVIQDKVENVLAEALLRDDIKRGDKVSVDPRGFRLIIYPR